MTRYSKTMSESLAEVRKVTPEEIAEASARRDAMRHGAGGRRGIDPADRDDMKATDKDQDLAKKNMIMQLRKSKDTRGNFSIEFQDGKKQKVDSKFVELLLKAHDMIQKPRDKEQFVQMISKSYRDMLNTAKMVSKQLRMGEEVFLEGFEVEEIEIDEMKMDDPKLNKIFDKLKKGQTIKLKTSSTISKGKDFVDYIVKSKNTVNKGKVEKVTLVTKGNEKSVKKFLYKRDGKVTFAIGDMGASIDDIKEELDEGKMKDLHGYISKGMSAQDIAKKMKLDVKTIQALMDETDLDEAKSSTGYELYHKDFSSAMQHAYAFAKKKFGIEVDPKEIDDKVATGPAKPKTGKTNSYRLQAKGGKKGIQVQVYNTGKTYELNMYKEEAVTEEEVSENKSLIKDYEKYMSQSGKKSHNAFDYLMSMPKYKRMSKDQMTKIIGDAKRKGIFKEEEEPQKSDGVKSVEQGRDDKKKTRIAQLQLQIAKATETINKLNAQEK